jgi:cellulose biosynthesis protein BcsQ
MSFLLQRTADKFNADYILIDLSPSLGAINQNLVMTSDFLIIPTYPDLFSLMAIDSLLSIFPKCYGWAVKASSSQVLKDAYYPFPTETSKFSKFPISLGTLRKALNEVSSNDYLLENEIQEYHSYRSFQRPDKIAEAIRLISDKKLWEEVSVEMGSSTQLIKEQLCKIIERRDSDCT